MASFELLLRDIKESLTRIEKKQKIPTLAQEEHENMMFAELLPLKTIQSIQEVESLLETSNEATAQFVIKLTLYFYLSLFSSILINASAVFFFRNEPLLWLGIKS